MVKVKADVLIAVGEDRSIDVDGRAYRLGTARDDATCVVTGKAVPHGAECWVQDGRSDVLVVSQAAGQDILQEYRCIQDSSEACSGDRMYRMPLSGTGTSFVRCDAHWESRLDIEDTLRERYPVMPPLDFDPTYAGEAWGEDDY